MLAGVLLLVVAAARGVDQSRNLGARYKRLADEVPHLAVLVLFDALYGHFELGAAGGDGDEGAGVPGLAAALGIEGRLVE